MVWFCRLGSGGLIGGGWLRGDVNASGRWGWMRVKGWCHDWLLKGLAALHLTVPMHAQYDTDVAQVYCRCSYAIYMPICHAYR